MNNMKLMVILFSLPLIGRTNDIFMSNSSHLSAMYNGNAGVHSHSVILTVLCSQLWCA